MSTAACDLTTGLAPYSPNAENPWNEERIKHLYMRMSFGADHNTIQQALANQPNTLVNSIINQGRNAPKAAAPPWANWALSQYSDFQTQLQEQVLSWALVWMNDMLTNSFRGKLTVFWHNHFVTKLEAYACPSYMYQYYSLLENHVFGNFKTFVKEIGKTPAMLLFLNGVQNTRFEPNENYARELLELFTLGRDNGYTQQDIAGAARALTGWNGFTELCAPIGFVPLLHDPGAKTIFGKTGNYTYDGLHDLLFQERGTEIARHICGKLYEWFVSPERDEEFINELAEELLANDFELLPVYRTLFASERFFDEKVIGNMIKSPLDYFLSFLKTTKLPYNQDVLTLILLQASENGQLIFNPPDVKGWPGNKTWVDTSRLTQRWLGLEYYLYLLFGSQPDLYALFIKELTTAYNDPHEITADLVKHVTIKGFDDSRQLDAAVTAFKWEVPQNYFDEGSWNLDWPTVPAQVALLLQFVTRTPEYQLM